MSIFLISSPYMCVIYVQKLNEHQIIFRKRVYQEEDREKWAKVLQYDMMSSEESGDESQGQKDCIVVKTLPWRSSRVNKFMESLDERMKDEKSNQSLRQMKKRIIAVEPSSRPKPGGHFPSWAFN